MKYKVLITTSGLGSRLGDLTRYMNKALVRVGKKPVIAYIIESYPKNTEFVITLGNFGEQVRDFLELAYSDRIFTFVRIDKFSGEGSSLAYSMQKAARHLQCPFVFHACDTIVDEKIPHPTENWSGGYKGSGSSQYRSFNIVDGVVQKIFDKGMMDTDYLHIGLVGIKDYKKFWSLNKKILKEHPGDSSLGDVNVLSQMIDVGHRFKVKEFNTWHDIGNVDSLNATRRVFEDTSFNVLDKLGESIYVYDKFVIKFFSDKDKVRKRVARGKILEGLVPKILGEKINFYKYSYVPGTVYSESATVDNFNKLLTWSERKLWLPETEVSNREFKSICRKFYEQKSIDRINEFLESRSIDDTEDQINGVRVGTIKSLIEAIDFDWLSNTEQTHFHGDFILDNIIQTKTGFSLVDWRQDFGGLMKSGDKYYDLAKLNHNLTINHQIINTNLFSVKVNGNEIDCEIMRRQNLVECQQSFYDFLRRKNYDLKKVNILTSLIWLNMSPLHHHPFDLFLYYFGKLNLWRALTSNIKGV